MGTNPGTARPIIATLLACTAALGAGCSSPAEQGAEPTDSPIGASTADLSPLPAEQTPPGTAGISPDGVTTSVDVPSDATESEYGQACIAAKIWMDDQDGDRLQLIEPYLKILQAPDFSDPGNFNTPWAQLTAGQQAGVIMAANAAANGECG